MFGRDSRGPFLYKTGSEKGGISLAGSLERLHEKG